MAASPATATQTGLSCQVMYVTRTQGNVTARRMGIRGSGTKAVNVKSARIISLTCQSLTPMVARPVSVIQKEGKTTTVTRPPGSAPVRRMWTQELAAASVRRATMDLPLLAARIVSVTWKVPTTAHVLTLVVFTMRSHACVLDTATAGNYFLGQCC